MKNHLPAFPPLDIDLPSLLARLGQRLAPPPHAYRPFIVAGCAVGRVTHATAKALARWPALFSVLPTHVELSPHLDSEPARTDALNNVVQALYRDALFSGWRDEMMAVARHYGGPPLFRIERAAMRTFGLTLYAAHLNGICRDNGIPEMWLARRSLTKAIDPGRFDTLVGGGLSDGLGIMETLVKESEEEAGIDAACAQQAVAAGTVRVRRPVDEGWHDEAIFMHDLVLPAAFQPMNKDGEVQEFTRLPLPQVLHLMSHSDEVTTEASFVICDYMMRTGFIGPDTPGHAALYALIHVH